MINLWIKLPQKGKSRKVPVDGKGVQMESVMASLEREENIAVQHMLLLTDDGNTVLPTMQPIDCLLHEPVQAESFDIEKNPQSSPGEAVGSR